MNTSLLIRFGLIAITLVIYWQVTQFDFVDFDDPDYVRNSVQIESKEDERTNPRVLDGLTWNSITWAFTTNHVGNWHPMTWLSLMLDAELYGHNPSGYHLTNLVFHILNVVLLFALLEMMTGALWRSAFVAALLALHPLHVESVAWISERKDVLSLLFMLLTLWYYISYVREGGQFRYIGTLLLFALGLMTKPMLVTLPCVLLLLDYWPLKRMGKSKTLVQLFVEKIPFFIFVASSSIVTIIVQQYKGDLEDGEWLPLTVCAANAFVSYVLYLGKLFWPVNLAALYPNPAVIGAESWAAWQIIASLITLSLITSIVIILGRTQRYLTVGWLWYLGTLVPVIGFIQIGRHIIADRYIYIPAIGLYIFIAWLVTDLTSRIPRRGVLLGVIASCVLITLAVLTNRQAGVWRDSNTLFEHTLAVTEDNWLIHNNYAAVLRRQDRHEEGLEHLNKALNIYPECGWLYDHLGDMHAGAGEFFSAQIAYEHAITLDPEDAELYSDLGVVLARLGKPEEAIAKLEYSLELNPELADAHKNLGYLLVNDGRYKEAFDHLLTAIELRPELATGDLQRLIERLTHMLSSPPPTPSSSGISGKNGP